MTLFEHGPHLDLVTLVPSWTSPASGDSSLLVGLTWTWGVGLPPAPHLELLTLVLSRASPVPGDPGAHLGLTWTW